jgi:hypothetical protein
VLRILMVVALILAVGQASGAVWFGEDTCTSDDCGDAAAGKDCPPNCPTCACAPMIQSLPATRVVVELEPIRTECSRGEPTPERFITTPDPREILHVPKHGA